MNEQNKEFLLQINKLKNLPALPEASLRIVDAINNPDISIDELTLVLSLSPGLVARLLGLANSAYFRQRKQINDLQTAIYQVLGLDLVKSLSLGIVLNVQFDTRKCHSFNTKYFWMRSLFTAVAAQKLSHSNKLRQFSPATVYTCGLLLYIGILVLGYLMPKKLNDIFLRCQQTHSCISQEIYRELGENHFRVGNILLQKWQLSPVYQSVLLHYENEEFCGEEKPLIKLLALSQRISSMMLDADGIDLSSLASYCERVSISADELPKIVNDLQENRENVQELAIIMGN